MGTPRVSPRLLALGLLLAALCSAFAHPAAAEGLNATRRLLKGGGTQRRSQGSSSRGSGFWSVKGTNYVDSNGQTVYFSGVTWSGFETPDAVAHGLHKRRYTDHLDQMKSLGFNMIRLAFAGDTLKKSTYPNGNIYGPNPELRGMTSLQVMDKIIDAAGKRGIKVILDYHRLRLTVSNEWGAWFDGKIPESTWIGNWVMLAKRYKGNPTIIGADLFNEVHPGPGMPKGAPFWRYPAKTDEKYNFRAATERVISAIYAVEPHWIFFLEGMHNNYWWGGNVAALEAAPITWPAGKIAYSAHEYGPYVFQQGWFFAKDFPRSLRRMMTDRWGGVMEKGAKPVWVGEFGSFYPKPDSNLNRIERESFENVIAYIQRLKASWTIAFWDPLSKDTGGILTNDWYSVNSDKMRALSGIMYPNFGLKQ